MNSVCLVGRLTANPEVRYTSDNLAVARFTVAVNRMKKDEADFIGCKAFGKTADLLEQYFHKGKEIGITGRIQTGSYQKEDGTKVYTTEVIAERIDFIGSKSADANEASETPATGLADGFEPIDDDIPF